MINKIIVTVKFKQIDAVGTVLKEMACLLDYTSDD